MRIPFSKISEMSVWVINKIKAHSTVLYTIFTGIIMVVMLITMCQQGRFNKGQLELEKLRAIPQVFARPDRLLDVAAPSHNVFYLVSNVSTATAVKLRQASEVNRSKINPFKDELYPAGVIADLFPTEKRVAPTREDLDFRGDADTLYFHLRLDYEDLLHHKYSYRATYWILGKVDSVKGTVTYRSLRSGYEWSEFEQLGKK